MAKAKKSKKQLVPRTHNAGTMTESAFWSFIRSALRQKSRWWKPISIAKQKAKRAYKGKNKRQKFEYKCAGCGNYFPDKEVNVDHIIPAGKLNSYGDLPEFVRKLFCEEDNLQVLCKKCHDIKTKQDKLNTEK
jgi:5-methylcytosine-specific restriction endonuclease McrA